MAKTPAKRTELATDEPAVAGEPAKEQGPRTRDDVPRTRKVRATAPGYYNDERRRTGDVFRIRHPYTLEGKTYEEFSAKWMEDADEDAPERTTTATEQLRKEHDKILQSRSPQGMNVLGD